MKKKSEELSPHQSSFPVLGYFLCFSSPLHVSSVQSVRLNSSIPLFGHSFQIHVDESQILRLQTVEFDLADAITKGEEELKHNAIDPCQKSLSQLQEIRKKQLKIQQQIEAGDLKDEKRLFRKYGTLTSHVGKHSREVSSFQKMGSYRHKQTSISLSIPPNVNIFIKSPDFPSQGSIRTQWIPSQGIDELSTSSSSSSSSSTSSSSSYRTTEVLPEMKVTEIDNVLSLSHNKEILFHVGRAHYRRREFTKAKEILEKPTLKKNALALFMLGMMAYRGWGQLIDQQKGCEYWEEARALGSAGDLSKIALARAHYEGINELRDLRKAKELSNDYLEVLQPYLDQNDPDAQLLMGQFTSYSYGAAFQWYERSAAQGNLLAIVMMGICYASGLGIKKDQVKGVELCQEAALKGDSLAQDLVDFGFLTNRNRENATAPFQVRRDTAWRSDEARLSLAF